MIKLIKRFFWQQYPDVVPDDGQLVLAAMSEAKNDTRNQIVATYKIDRIHDGIDYGPGFIAGSSGKPLTCVYFWKSI